MFSKHVVLVPKFVGTAKQNEKVFFELKGVASMSK
jgi:hypothetical protein